MTAHHTPRKRSNAPLFFVSLLTSTALAGVAAAQTQSDEIIVTATKRSENIQDVPLSVQALGERTLDQHQVSSFDDYATLLPSVSYQSFGPGQAQLAFRGVTSGGDGLPIGSSPTASMYVDDTPVTTIGSSVDLHIYDIDRVEALSGPQGTLFGASSLSGVVRIITNQPDPSGFEAGYDVEANKFTDGEAGGSFEGFANLPLGDRIALRVVGFYEREGGYIDNVPGSRTYILGDTDPTTNLTVNNSRLVADDINSVETYGGRAALRIDLNDNWTSTTTAMGQHQQVDGPFLYDPFIRGAHDLRDPLVSDDLVVRDYVPTSNEDQWWMISQTIQGRIGNFDLVYAGSYFDRKIESVADYSYYTVAYDTLEGYYYTNIPDGSGGFVDPTQWFSQNEDYTKETHELRVTSPADYRFRVTAGLFYQKQTNHDQPNFFIPGLGAAPPTLNPTPIPGFGDSLFIRRLNREDTDTAVFGEASFDFTEALTVTAGVRLFKAENSLVGFSGFASNIGACYGPATAGGPCDNINKTFEEESETYKLSASYDIDDDRMVYVTYSTGYRPGGVNRRAGIVPYVADTLTNFEIGAKTMWLDRRLRLNGAIFFQDWDDLQMALSPLGSAGVTNIYNAGTASIKGAEIDASYTVGGFTLSGSGSLIDANLTSDFCAFDALGNSVCLPGEDPAAPSGTQLPVQPKFKATATARYNFMLGSWESFVQGTVLHQSQTRPYLLTSDFFSSGGVNTEPFTTLDLSIGGEHNDLSLEAFLHNATDERGVLTLNTSCAPTFCGFYARAYPVQPRIFGVRLSQRF
ncbi:MAG: TonB-dependent receptor [Hyphomonadaceae bacterium]|nr:TonB-dependent receptor [Hyphomonadaceae bacterium]